MAGLEKTFEKLQPNPAKDQTAHCAGQKRSGMDGSSKHPPLLNLVIKRFEGETCEGQPSGEGVTCFEGGHVYKGMFSKGLMDGHGAFTWAGGLKYEGNFVCNIIMGQGMYSWPDGSTYQGEVQYGTRHGSGTYYCAKSGVVYKGQWNEGKRQGKGAIYFNQDETNWYKGDWVANRIEGSGVRRYLSGNTYTGEWMHNLRQGEGTMKWLLHGQQYEGTWHNGVQHGRGKHTWILKREDASRFPQSNQYVGDFVCGQRHGQGAFYYADGAVYEGEWRNNKKHGLGTITFKNGKIFQGEFADDQIVQLRNDRPLPPLALNTSSVLGPDMNLDIDDLLSKFPEQRRDSELKEVEFAVWKHSTELRAIYNFYSRLGFFCSPDHTVMLSRMQLWRLLKDCKVHHHDITLCQIDLLTGDEATSTDVHSPFTRMLFRELLTCLVVVAYHIHHKDMISQRNLLASCFYKLMANNILPNAKNVKGYLFKWPECTDVAMGYCRRSWEVYQRYCTLKSASGDDKAMTCGDLLFMFKDLNLLDNQLRVTNIMEVITKESVDPSNTRSCLNHEMTFLDFFETLLGCAEVKCQLDGDGFDQVCFNDPEFPNAEKAEFTSQSPTRSSPTVTTPVNSPISSDSEVEATGAHTHETSTSLSEVMVDGLLLAEPTEENEGRKGKPTELELPKSQFRVCEETVKHFFDHIFFHAFEQYQWNCQPCNKNTTTRGQQLHR